ncbi:hypothetical protein OESDEN_20526 [Oesophagostomum dentatum]|uniref:Uncharacterized protein n=1 Tax=Oesophagostomum dentatum TaxID=61180 RepID=A0A0B1S4F0_OESDE|nr:hypothetical protein OESDEN_20526 [Oesophagostomum dentatum]
MRRKAKSSVSVPPLYNESPTVPDVDRICAQMDKLLSAFNSMSRQVFSRLEDVESRQMEMEHVLQSHARLGEEVKNAIEALKASTTEVLTRIPPATETPPALTYPYKLTKEQVDEIQLKETTATSFARKVERKLFEDEKDKNEKLEMRAAQDKVRWLRELVNYRYPSKNGVRDNTVWSACKKGINDYHTKQRKRVELVFADIPRAEERNFYPAQSSEHVSPSVSPENQDQEYLFTGSPTL